MQKELEEEVRRRAEGGRELRHARRPATCTTRRRCSTTSTRTCRRICARQREQAGSLTMASMTMIQAIRSAMDVMLGRDDNVVVFGEDVGYFGGVFRCTDGLQAKYGTSRVFDTPIAEGGIVGVAIGMGAYGLRPVAEIQFADYIYPGLRPDRVRGGAAALSLGRRLHRADHDPHALRRRHLRRADAQPEPRGAVHPRVRPAHGDAVQPVRRQGPADRVDRVRRPGDLPRAQAHLQRPVRRSSRPAGRAVVRASARPKCPRATTRCRSSRRRSCRPGAALTVLAYGTMVWVSRGRGARDRHRRRDHRPAQPRGRSTSTRSSTR